PLPWPIGVTIVAQALEGLAHAHGLIDAEGRPLQLVHRDISPQNIMVGFDGQVRLFDFGIAQTNQQQAHQRAGVLSGKVAYLSPEQCRGQTIDARSDLFGMGVLLYELLTQTRLFKRAGQLLTLKAVVEEPIPPLRSIAPDLPGELERVVLHALERDPAQRYASAREMADDLNAWLAGSGQPGGSSMLAGYLAELFGEEMRREEEEHARLLLLPDPAGPPRATPAAVVRHPSNPPPPAPAPGEERATTTPLGAATSPLGAATSPLGAATSPLGAATSPLGEVAVASPAGQQPPAPLPELPAVIVEVVPPRGRPVHGRTELAAAVTATSTASTSPLDMAPHQAAEPHPVPWLRSLLVAFGLAVCIVLAAAIVVLVAAKVG
ncbi:MAG: hypothetical protein FJ125_04925, partial [Deltaproteobacteria bacterium]|nr:hypothetical protein [Deltaproteobacteria bacterium]